MKIASSTISNNAAAYYAKKEEVSQNIRFEKTDGTSRTSKTDEEASQEELKNSLDPKLRMMVDILERLTGKKITIASMSSSGNASLQIDSSGGNTQMRVGWGLEISTTYTMQEQQALSFSSSGKALTESGQQIEFSLNLQFSREFVMSQSSMFRAGDALSDPLVISFDGSSPIGDGKFSFDLLKGGAEENISYLSGGSGFLALDKNGDGQINNGTELFGPKSGNGFTELAAYDDDKNGWIDENDSVFKSLKLWVKTANEDNVISLKEAGVGAISLQAVAGTFDFKDSQNSTLAQIKNTSVALSESGEALPVYGLDLSI